MTNPSPKAASSKKILIGIIVLILLAAGMFFLWKSSQAAPSEGGKAITVTVIHSGGDEAEFSYQTDLTYLGELLQSEGLISGEEGPYGLFVDTVDGETVSGSDWWSLACNGEAAQTGVEDRKSVV